MNNPAELNLMGTTVAVNDNGLFSLNDLWKASGGKNKDMPSRWVRLKRTQNVINSLKKRESVDRKTVNEISDNDLSAVIKSSANAGTFVNRVLVFSYAMHVSADFEIEVIRAFDKQAQKKLKQAKAEWQQNRELGKLTHRNNTDTIKTFLAYAAAQGSKGYPKQGYMIITKMINQALSIDDRDSINEQTLHIVATAELICENALQAGMDESLPYKTIFQSAKMNVTNFAAMAMGDRYGV